MSHIIFVSGVNLIIEAVSPSIIILRLPDKLVIETQTSGGYLEILWTKDGNSPSSNVYINFGQTFLVESTNMADLGRYGVTLIPFPGSLQQFPPEIFFDVILHGTATIG